jgi:hypothetical protein
MRESLYRTSQTLLVFVRVVFFVWIVPLLGRGCHGGDHMVVGFTTTYAIGACHHWCCEFESRKSRCTTLRDKVYQWLATGRWFSQGTLVSSANKTYCHDITEILLKVAWNTIQPTNLPLLACSRLSTPSNPNEIVIYKIGYN